MPTTASPTRRRIARIKVRTKAEAGEGELRTTAQRYPFTVAYIPEGGVSVVRER
jgi:hypothetical protein